MNDLEYIEKRLDYHGQNLLHILKSLDTVKFQLPFIWIYLTVLMVRSCT